MVNFQADVSSPLAMNWRYEIRIRGELDQRWSDWFSGIEISIERPGCRPALTTLTCPKMDQARLRGILNRIWDLNLSLVSVKTIEDPSLNEILPEMRAAL